MEHHDCTPPLGERSVDEPRTWACPDCGDVWKVQPLEDMDRPRSYTFYLEGGGHPGPVRARWVRVGPLTMTSFVDWTWAVSDDEKPVLAEKVKASRAETEPGYLHDARQAAEDSITGPVFERCRQSAMASAAPADWLEDTRDMELWNNVTGSRLQEAYTDALLALAACDALGKGHRRVLAEALLASVPGLGAALGLG